MDERLLVIDKDECPKPESVIYRGYCTDCKYYVGFELYAGMPCINAIVLTNISIISESLVNTMKWTPKFRNN